MNGEIDLRQLRYFVAVAEELHFGRAARRLGMAQPPLSQQIRKLEDLVGGALFARTSRSVALTAAGRALLPRAQRLLGQLDADVAEARAVAHGDAGRFDVGFVSSAILLDVPDRFVSFRQAHPDVELRLHEGFTATTAERLRAGEIDAAFVRDLEPHAALTITRYATERFVAVLPADHPRAAQRTIDAGALRDEPFVFFPRSAGELAYARNLGPCRERGFEPRIVQEALHWATVVQLVAVGVGVTIAPVSAASAAPDAVRCVPLRGSKSVSEVQFARRAGDDRAIVHAFAATVERGIRARV